MKPVKCQHILHELSVVTSIFAEEATFATLNVVSVEVVARDVLMVRTWLVVAP
jgi:hypothetical protein